MALFHQNNKGLCQIIFSKNDHSSISIAAGSFRTRPLCHQKMEFIPLSCHLGSLMTSLSDQENMTEVILCDF